MRIRLLKKDSTSHGTYPIGTILQLTKSLAAKKIEEGKAEKYSGEYPPKKKMKTNFFNPNKTT